MKTRDEHSAARMEAERLFTEITKQKPKAPEVVIVDTGVRKRKR